MKLLKEHFYTLIKIYMNLYINFVLKIIKENLEKTIFYVN